MRRIVLLGLLFASPAIAQMPVAGFTPGSFRVTESGAAEYRIPIRVPPGIGGMEPKLALVYNSQSGNGLLGVGWNLEGLSTITRCPRTMAQDGVRGAVSYDWNDRYCLDGQRLIAINGSYGADGTEYRAEREPFSKIVSHGIAGNGPAWFEVRTKSGLILEYGRTDDSRIEAQGKTSARLWALNAIADHEGRYLRIAYFEDRANSEFHPTRIDYAGNSALSQPPQASVRFVYLARPDLIYLDVAGSTMRTSLRLVNVRSFVAETMLTDYRLAYEQGTATGRSRLAGISECTADGSSCLAARLFAWQEPVVGPQNWHWTGGHGDAGAGWRFADLFGDGRPVFWSFDGAGMHVATRLNPDGTLQNWTWRGGHGHYGAGWDLVDLFGDGRPVFWSFNGAGSHVATRLNPDGTLQNWTWAGGHGYHGAGWRLADLFGDGRRVFWSFNGAGSHVATRLNPDGTLQNWTWAGGHGHHGAGWDLADLFGDGRQIFWSFNGAGSHVATRLDPDGTLQNWTWVGGHGHYGAGWRLADLFADGRQTFWSFNGAGSHVATRLNPDGTLQNWSWAGGHGHYGAGWDLADLFGDGREIFWSFNGAGSHVATRLQPDGTLQNWTWAGAHGYYGAGWRLVDLFGDGRQAFWSFNGAGSHVASRFASAAPDLLVSGTDGLGNTTSVAYKPLTDGGVYVRDSGANAASYPTVDLQPAIHAVYSASASNGIGGSQTTIHQYGGLKVNREGRGLLGLRWTRSTRQSTGLELRTENRQDWPYIGLPSMVRRTQASGAVLSQTLNTYGSTSPATGVYFPFVSQSVETGTDLNGAALPTTATTTQYDSFGNPTVVTVSTPDGHSRTTTNTFTNDAASWRLGRLTRSTVQSTGP